MLRDFGVESRGVVYAYPSAALAIAKRKGAGKLRHTNINCLWIQEKQDTKQLELRKVLGTENPAAMMTKHLARQSLDKCMRHLNQCHVTRRAKAGLDVQGSKSAEKRPGGAPSGPRGISLSTPAESIGAVNANDEKALPQCVKFGEPIIIQVPNWKQDTKAMRHNPPPVLRQAGC